MNKLFILYRNPVRRERLLNLAELRRAPGVTDGADMPNQTADAAGSASLADAPSAENLPDIVAGME